MWLIDKEAYKDYMDKFQTMKAGDVPSDFEFSPELTTNSGGVAHIPVKGVLLPERSGMLDFFGVQHTSYDDIIDAVSEANNNKEISSIVLDVSSPGGRGHGMYAAMDAIAKSGKPVTAVVKNMATSAAYMLASQTSKIVASTPMDDIGSLGVAIDHVAGKVLSVTNTKSPLKRNNVTTEEGFSAEQKELDDFYAVVAEKVAAGRGVKVETVYDDYGKGAVMPARTALKKGLIDGINGEPVEDTTTDTGVKSMNLQEFKASNGELYSQIKADAVQQERDRVNAHILLGEASGDMETTLSAIKDGTGVTDTVKAKHLAAEIKNRSIDARQDETVEDVQASASVEDEETKAKRELEARDDLIVEF